MTEKVFSGKTVEDAVKAGLAELKLTREEVKIEVLEEGKKRLFGSIPAQVKLTVIPKLTDGERSVKFLEGLFEILGHDVVPTLMDESEKIVIELSSETAKKLIGRRGEVIDAIQTLAGAVANTGREEYVRVIVDCGNYREDREETLKHVAEKYAAKAVRLGKRMRLEPMNPDDRRIIHAALVDNPNVTTKSEGKEPARYVVITPKEIKRDHRSKDRSRDRYGKNDRKSEKKAPRRELPDVVSPQTAGTSLSRGTSGSYKKGSFSGFFGTFLGNSRDEETPETPASDEE